MQSLHLYRPIRSSRISQHFGENKACWYPSGTITSKGSKGCPDGSHDFYRKILGMKGHNGTDLPGITGENVCHAASFDGWMRTEKDSAGGLGVDVISKKPLFFVGNPPSGLTNVVDHVQNGVKGFLCHVFIRYWHLHAYVGHDGKDVVFGQPIGLLGSTGASSAPHLHWAWKFCDVDGKTLNPNNGYRGAYDPASNDFGVTYNHDIFSYDSARYMSLKDFPADALSPNEKSDIAAQLSVIRRMALALRERIATL